MSLSHLPVGTQCEAAAVLGDVIITASLTLLLQVISAFSAPFCLKMCDLYNQTATNSKVIVNIEKCVVETFITQSNKNI